MLYAVIDTNVLVSALLSSHDDSSTVVVRNHILEGTIVPLYNEEIYQEWIDFGAYKNRRSDPRSERCGVYEVALSKEGSYLVTGNTKHFPKTPIVVTPSELLEIIKNL